MPVSRVDPASAVVRNVARLAAGETVARAAAAVASVYLARMLGPSGFGVIGIAAATFSYFLLVIDGGHAVLAVREIARGADARRMAGVVLGLRLAIAVAVLALVPLLSWTLSPGDDERALLLRYALTGVSSAATLTWVYQALEDMRVPAIASILRELLFLVGALLLVRGPLEILRIPLLRAGADGLAALLVLVLLWRRLGPVVPSFAPRALAGFMLTSLPFFAARALRACIYNADILLLGFLSSREIVGWYAAAYAVVYGVLMLNVFFAISVFPVVSRSLKADPAEARRQVTAFHRAGAMVAMPAAVGIALLAAPLVNFLFANSYAPAAPFLALLAGSLALLPLSENLRRVLFLGGRERLDAALLAVALGVNIGLNLWLIPRLGGSGAALATVATEALILLGAWCATWRSIGRTPLFGPVWRPLVAALAMGLVVWPLRALPLALPIVAGAVTYALLLLMLDGALRGQVVRAVAGFAAVRRS